MMANQSYYNDRKDCTRSFFEAIAEPVLYVEEAPYRLMTKKLNDIDIDYFEKIDSAPLGKTLDKEIEIGIKHQILSDFVTYGNELQEKKTKDIEKAVVANVRSLVVQYDDQTEALHDLNKSFGYIHKFVRKQLCFVPIPMYDNAELRELYASAKRVTLIEKVTGSNDKDVIKYYHALIEHCVWACRMLLRRRTGQFLMRMVDILSREFDMNSQWATSYNVVPSPIPNYGLPKELLPLMEMMAKNVHEVWMKTRLEQGWTYGSERNDAEKKHPCLVPYNQLPEEEKDYDRNTSIETLRFIISHGFRIEKD